MGEMAGPSTRDPGERERLLGDLLLHQTCVLCLCLGYARNADLAEELAQETYLKAMRSLDGLKDGRAAKVWLCRIAKHTCLDHLKKERIGREALSRFNPEAFEERSPETAALERENRRVVKESILRLPKGFRDIIIMREYAGLTYEEIARVLGRRMGTVMSRLNRARRLLAAIVRERENGE